MSQTTANISSSVSSAHLARYEPLCAMSSGSVDRLVSLVQTHPVRRGMDVLTVRSWSDRIVYLLSGELKLEYPGQMVVVAVGGSGRGLQPIINGHVPGSPATDRHEPVAIQAITECQLMSLDRETVDLVATWDQLADQVAVGADSNTSNNAGNAVLLPQWRDLSGLCADQSLVASAFSSIPSANIPRLLQCFSQQRVSKGDVVIQQGDPGDFYYLIERGRCRVTRQIAGVSSEIAELCDGEGFGEEALVSSAVRNATVTMKTDGVIWRLAKRDFVSLLQEPLLRKTTWADAQSESLAKATWIDIRFPVEFKQNGLPDAINIPLNEIRQATTVLDPKTDYIVYCQTGRRSSAAAFLLSQRGIPTYWLDGGLNAIDAAMEAAA